MNKPRYRKPTTKSRFYVHPSLWNHAISFCRCYPLWIAELAACDSSRAIRYDTDRVQTSGNSNPTEQLGMKRADLQRKIDIIDRAAEAVTESDPLRRFLMLGVTHGLSYDTLDAQGIPCGRRKYHEMRREMIFIVSKSI